jgi:superfamily II DNA or RNA helicase
MTHWRWGDPIDVRSTIATLSLRAQPADSHLGDIVLREHQRDAAGRLRDAIDRFGGALLADEVGLGKTFTALAAARDATSVLVVAPATLASMWRLALERSHLHADFISYETLSHRDAIGPPYQLVIVDEAHHARNPLTRRYDRLAALTRDAHVLLLSATPVHNAVADLHALLALFLGSRAQHLTPLELASCIVRRTRADMRDVETPRRAEPQWLPVSASTETLRAVLDIPAPCPPSDGGDGGALIGLSLVRAWASTEAALRHALRRRIARADSLADALTAGRHPTRAELRAWVVGDDATQLAFPELMAQTMASGERALLDQVRDHAAGARRALAVVNASGGAMDDERCALIREIRRRHAAERVVVFSQFADSVHAMFARLRVDGRVAAVTANGAWVAGGQLTRTEVLARFAPTANGAGPAARAERIDLLIATDLLSEGLNLQDASVVVHLDLPWTAARLTQRLGRVWRIGSPHPQVHEYALAPPAPAEHVLHATDVLRRKAGDAWTTMGETFAPLLLEHSDSVDSRVGPEDAHAPEALRQIWHRWLHGPMAPRGSEAPEAAVLPARIAGVRAPFDAWIAVVERGDATEVIAARAGVAATNDPRSVLEVARAADGPARVTSPSRANRVLLEIGAYVESTRAAADAGVSAVGSRTHANAAGRIASLAASAPPHRRIIVSRLAAGARRAIDRARSAGAERLLGALVSAGDSASDTADAAEAWLERVIELGAPATPNAGPAMETGEPVVRAVLLLVC